MKDTAVASLILAGVILVLGCGGGGGGSTQDASVDQAADGIVDLTAETTPVDGAIVADHAAVAAFDSIPPSTFDQIRSNYRFFYGHTSHGSQIMTGLDMLSGEDSMLYAVPDFDEVSDDLGHTGDVSWVPITEDRLDEAGSDYNVVMWSWCGGCSDNTEEGI
ncbi:MAG: hypothetical protein JRG91_12490, partial [Deltaproteobacteria bacterium]|nr:hypothetical protein [Deltaproteobacteria bacterium]